MKIKHQDIALNIRLELHVFPVIKLLYLNVTTTFEVVLTTYKTSLLTQTAIKSHHTEVMNLCSLSKVLEQSMNAKFAS